MKTTLGFLLPVALFATLAGCGNKGALVHPTRPTPSAGELPVPATTAPAAPADTTLPSSSSTAPATPTDAATPPPPPANGGG